jgi:4-diphosphocytidyl-2-C-methyl-D-erythritol kinase
MENMKETNRLELKKKSEERINVYSPAGTAHSIGSVSQPRAVTIFSPAKINVFLAVTGLRGDGYHDLVSVVAPLDFGDDLLVTAFPTGSKGGPQFCLECGDPEVPLDESNLVLRAARAFAAAADWKESVTFRLTKRIPVGAGLGGGSSNATAALKALNELSGANLGRPELAALAAGIGSDCPLFLEDGPVVMRGRGERVERLPGMAARRLRGRKVLIFKPAFGVSTAWAYGQIAAGAPQSYLPAPDAERRVAALIDAEAGIEDLLINNLEPVVFRKFLALPVLLNLLRDRFGLAPRMSGSGSACFALLPPDAPVSEIVAAIRDAWGAACFVQEAAIG